MKIYFFKVIRIEKPNLKDKKESITKFEIISLKIQHLEKTP